MIDAARSINVDPAVLAVALTTALRRSGIPSTPERAGWLVEALRVVPPRTRSTLYWTCRTVLVTREQQLPAFDAAFAAIFDDAADPADSRGDPNAPDLTAVRHRPRATDGSAVAERRDAKTGSALQAATAGTDSSSDDGQHGPDAIVLATSVEERLHSATFSTLDDDELAQIQRLVAALAVATPLRPGRRRQHSPRKNDRLDLRRTVRAARRNGGDAVRLVHSTPQRRRRRLVLLCDVSASMEPYTRVFLSLMQAAVIGARAEAFVFATRLTRVTRHLDTRDPDSALERAAEGAQDWHGGTRLADGIRAFIDEHGRRGAARGAVVVILSDGWAQDDPADIAHQMARLSRLAYRVIWVNPRKAAPGFQPLTGGMAAALPYCDAFVSGHSYHALLELVRLMQDDGVPPKRRRVA